MVGGSLADDGGSQESAALVEHALLDDLVCLEDDRLRNRQPKCLRRLQIDHEFELRRLFYREIGRLGAFQDPVYVGGGTWEEIRRVRVIRHQTTGIDDDLVRIHSRQSVLGGKLDHALALGSEYALG